MSDDLYRPPAMPLYVDRFMADTADLTNEELGAYVRLMFGKQWPKGRIPADPAKQARIAGNISTARMKKISAAIGDRLQPHPIFEDSVHSPFMERVRDEMRERSEERSQKARSAAQKRWNEHSERNADAMPEHSEGNADAMQEQCERNALHIPYSNKDTNVSGDGAPKQQSLGVGKPSDIAAYRILDAAWPIVSSHREVAMTQKKWRQANKSAAADLVAVGKTPEQVAAMITLAYTHPEGKRFYGGIVMLAKLAEHWPKLAALENEPEDDEQERRKAIMRGDYMEIC